LIEDEYIWEGGLSKNSCSDSALGRGWISLGLQLSTIADDFEETDALDLALYRRLLRRCQSPEPPNVVLVDLGDNGDNSLVRVDLCEGVGEDVGEREGSFSIWASRCLTTDKWPRFAMEGL
jgi:hypothetical protein